MSTFPWQADLYHCPDGGWSLLICDAAGTIRWQQRVKNQDLSPQWLENQLHQLQQREAIPGLRIFRPDCLPWFEKVCQQRQIQWEASRHTPALKALLKQNFGAQAIQLVSPPPQPLPDFLLGEKWQFLAIAAQDLPLAFAESPSRYYVIPDELMPLNLGLAADCPIPGVMIYGGQHSRRLGAWLAENRPMNLIFTASNPDESGGLVLGTGLIGRWIIATFTDPQMATAAAVFQKRQHQANGLHFLWVQPDEAGTTNTGIWLLRRYFDEG